MKNLIGPAAWILSPLLACCLCAEEKKPTPNKEPYLLNVYDVSDVVAPIRDFPSPTFYMGSSSRSSTGGGGTFGAAQGEVSSQIQAGDIAALIKERLLPEEFTDPATALEETGGKLVVMQHNSVHAKISQIIQSLRESTRPQVCVKAVLSALKENPEETYFDEAALTKLLNAEPDLVLASPRLVCYSGQRAHIVSGREMNVVADMEISGEAYDPTVNTVIDGHVLDVQALLSTDRSSAELTLDFKLNSNVKRTLKPIGFSGPAAAFSHVALPTSKSEESSSQKFAPDKKDPKVEEQKSSSTQDSGILLSSQYVSRVDMDSIAMDSNLIHAQVGVPAGKWVLAATFENPDEKSPQKHLQLFVSVEALGK